MKLLLFDIDGTLLRVAHSARDVLGSALEPLVGRTIITEGIRFSGRTDIPIIREVLLRSGCDETHANSVLSDALNAYREIGLDRLRRGEVRRMPGALELLNELSRRTDVVLGLLTGNIEDMAYAKLRAVGLDAFFTFGAFGSDRENRYELPAIALERAREASGIDFTGKRVVIIGDTEHDVMCGRGHGVFSVAVATGRFDREYLAGYNPDILLDDLTDYHSFIAGVVEAPVE